MYMCMYVCIYMYVATALGKGQISVWQDLKVLGLLGCGGFGAVELVEHNVTKETYALKAVGFWLEERWRLWKDDDFWMVIFDEMM